MGLLTYTFLAVGLGCWLNGPSRSGLSACGLRLVFGFAATIILLFVFGVVGRLSVDHTLWIVSIIAGAGLVYRFRACRWCIDWLTIARHPASVLLIAGGLAIILNGGIGYLPYTSDEFSHWLANPLRINAFGGWAAARDTLHIAGYTPGWSLLVLLPWQLLAEADLGASAAAPFVLHVAVVAFIFDLVVFLMRRRMDLGTGRCELLGWTFILLFLAAEALGPLWPATLLIEPPQMLGYTVFLLLLFATEIAPEDERRLEASAGVVLASCYLIKSAAMLFVPAVVALVAMRVIVRGANAECVRGAVISCVLVIGPILVTVATWGFISDARGCIHSPLDTLTPEALDLARNFDWRDLADRYISAIRVYVIAYKTPLTIAGAIGMAGALARGIYGVPLVLGIMATFYLAALYWYHLSCFGAYYFENLNSIPRFTRVLLRSLHGVGLVLLADVVLVTIARLFGPDGVRRCLASRWVLCTLVFLVVLLAPWQARLVYRSVDMVTTRTGQTIDPRIEEMRRAATVIERLKGGRLPPMPVLLVISQGKYSDVRNFARFFALSRHRGDTADRYRVSSEHSWSPQPVNVWQTRAGPERVRARLAEADIVWPTDLDPWLREILADLVEDVECLRALPNKALVRVSRRDQRPQFTCIDKFSEG